MQLEESHFELFIYQLFGFLLMPVRVNYVNIEYGNALKVDRRFSKMQIEIFFGSPVSHTSFLRFLRYFYQLQPF